MKNEYKVSGVARQQERWAIQQKKIQANTVNSPFLLALQMSSMRVN